MQCNMNLLQMHRFAAKSDDFFSQYLREKIKGKYKYIDDEWLHRDQTSSLFLQKAKKDHIAHKDNLYTNYFNASPLHHIYFR